MKNSHKSPHNLPHYNYFIFNYLYHQPHNPLRDIFYYVFKPNGNDSIYMKIISLCCESFYFNNAGLKIFLQIHSLPIISLLTWTHHRFKIQLVGPLKTIIDFN